MLLQAMGFNPSIALLGGAAGALLELARRGLVLRLIRCWPAYLGTFIWVLFNMFSGNLGADYINLLPTRQMILGCIYAVPAGYLIHQCQRRRGEQWILFGFTCAFAAMALVQLYIIQTANVTTTVSISNGMTDRFANNNSELTYFRFFSVYNIMISSISFTIFGFSLPILALMKVRLPVLATGAFAYALCLLVLQKLLTRTAFVAGFLASALMLSAVMRNEGGHLTRKRRRWIIGVLIGLAFVAGSALLTLPEFQIMRDRLLEAGDDTRKGLWLEAWQNVLRRPWGGGTYGMVTGGWAHNVILDFALYHGFLGAASMTSVLCLAWFRCWQLIRRKSAMDSPFTVLMATLMIAVSIAEMISPPFYPLVLFFYVFIGYSTSWMDQEKVDRMQVNAEIVRARNEQSPDKSAHLSGNNMKRSAGFRPFPR